MERASSYKNRRKEKPENIWHDNGKVESDGVGKAGVHSAPRNTKKEGKDAHRTKK